MLAITLSACLPAERTPINITDLAPMEGGLPPRANLKTVSGHSAEILRIFRLPAEVQAKFVTLISVDSRGAVLLWDLPQGGARQLMQLQSGIGTLAMREEKLLMAASYDSVVRIYGLSTGTEIASLSDLKARVVSLDFTPSGAGLLIGAADGRIYLWNFAQELRSGGRSNLSKDARQKILESYIGPAGLVSAVRAHPLGRLFFSGDWQGGLNAWYYYDADLFKGEYDKNLFGERFFGNKAIRTLAGRPDRLSVDHLQSSADGTALLAGMQDGSLELWQVRGFRRSAVQPAHNGLILDMAIAPAANRVATIGRDGRLVIWDFTLGMRNDGGEAEGKIDKVMEVSMPEARRVVFETTEKVVAGTKEGRLLEVSIIKQAA
ncbi:MAG: hypothetical protein K1X83_06485 [Oligoflexia bacterium]|nr:hypothetical protein [Oligoflexia bacterium]